MKKAVSLIASLILLACVLTPEHALCSRVSAAEENSSAATALEIRTARRTVKGYM